MNAVLNFSGESKIQVLEFLKKHESLETKSEFEEFRTKIFDCSVTLFKSGKLLIQGKSTEKVKELILEKVKVEDELILGIDESGRGESFGSLVVAGVLGFASSLRELRDSKKTKNINEKIKIVEKKAIATEHVEISSEAIDAMRSSGKNLNDIEAEAINQIISKMRKIVGKKFRIIVDGNNIKGVQDGVEFLPKADDLIVQVSAASVLAKFVRENSRDKGKRKTWKNNKENV